MKMKVTCIKLNLQVKKYFQMNGFAQVARKLVFTQRHRESNTGTAYRYYVIRKLKQPPF